MTRRFLLPILTALLTLPAAADEFDQLDGATLEAIARDKATSRGRLTVAEIGGMRSVLKGSRSALIVATTDQGNYTRLLVSPGLRKAQGGKGKEAMMKGDKDKEASGMVPVLVLERFDTFEAGNLKNRLAHGRDLLLFAGFRMDLDTGQVVPEGQGGDLQFAAGDAKVAALIPLEGSKLAAPTKLPEASAAPDRPSPGRAVKPGDFAGRYQLFANGQWSGALDLKVDKKGEVAGRFQSDQTGNSYPVTGKVATNPTNSVHFEVEYPRTRQDFDGLLFLENKGAIAGTTTMMDRPFGFFALREGGTFAPDGEDVGLQSNPAGRVEVAVKGARSFAVEGKELDADALGATLRAAVAADPAASVLLRVGGAVPFEAVDRAIEAARSAGVPSIRLAPAGRK